MRARRTASRNISICFTNRSERRSSRLTVKKYVPPETRLRPVVWHGENVPELLERRKALCFSALRLLAEILAGVPDDEQAEPAPDPDPGIAGGKAARVYNFDVAKLTAPA